MAAQDFDHAVAPARQQQVEDFAVFGMRMRIDGVFFLAMHARHGDNQGRPRAQRVHNVEQHIVAHQARQFDVEGIGQAVPADASPLPEASSSHLIIA